MKTLMQSLIVVILLTSCGSTKITKKEVLPKLDRKTKVTVFSSEAPTFTYKVICSATVKSNGMFTSTSMDSYRSKAETIARDCGAKIAVIKSLSGMTIGSNADVTVEIEAVRRTSQDAKIYDKTDYLKRLATAISVNKLSTIKAILNKFKVSKSPKTRSHLDSKVINTLLRFEAEKGKNCAVKSMFYLAKNYGSKIDTYADYEDQTWNGYTYSKNTTYINTSSILECPSSLVYKSIHSDEKIESSIIAISNSVTNSANSRSISKAQRKNYIMLYPKMMKEVNLACKKESTSSLCSLKSNLTKVYKYLKKLKV